jgi:hypothetical protein
MRWRQDLFPTFQQIVSVSSRIFLYFREFVLHNLYRQHFFSRSSSKNGSSLLFLFRKIFSIRRRRKGNKMKLVGFRNVARTSHLLQKLVIRRFSAATVSVGRLSFANYIIDGRPLNAPAYRYRVHFLARYDKKVFSSFLSSSFIG